MSTTLERCVAVLGPGLLGGSFAMAVKARSLAERVHVWARRSEAADSCAQRGIADVASSDLEAVLHGATLAVLATPVDAMSGLARKICGHKASLDPALLITDVGSIKASVVDEVGLPLKKAGITFVGSHPMAGSEQAGIEAARADLFSDAACILTPDTSAPRDQVDRLKNLWEALGCRVSELEPSAHDAVVGRISHLPHIAACALTIAALESDTADAGQFAGSGFRDSTRIAAGNPELWLGILRENQAALVEPLRNLHTQIGRALALIQDFNEEEMRQFLRAAQQLRRQSLPPGKEQPDETNPS